MTTVLHHSDERKHIRDLQEGQWIWDAHNEEPARFGGWHRGSYKLEWLSGGTFCMWDGDGQGQPNILEVLREEIREETTP